MKCPFCEEEVPSGAKYCPNCGTGVVQEKVKEEVAEDVKETSEEEPKDAKGEKEKTVWSGEVEETPYRYVKTEESRTYRFEHTDDGGTSRYEYTQQSVSDGDGKKTESRSTSFDPFGQNTRYGYGESGGSQKYGYGNSDNNQRYGYGNSNDQSSGNKENEKQYSASFDREMGSDRRYESQYGDYQDGDQFDNGMDDESYQNYVNGTPYLVFSILTTLCCCLPLGIAAIVYAVKIDSLQKRGDFQGAKRAAKKARNFCVVGAIGGLILTIIAGIGMVVGSGSSYVSGYDSVEIEEKERARDHLSEVPEGAWNQFSLMINGQTIQMPCEIKDIEKVGLEIEDDDYENEKVDAHDYDFIYFESEEDDYLMFSLYNDSGKKKKKKDCEIRGVYIADYNMESGTMTVVLPGGVQIGTEAEHAIEAWGEPSEMHKTDEMETYGWSDQYNNYCRITVDPETKKITNIDLDGNGL